MSKARWSGRTSAGCERVGRNLGFPWLASLLILGAGCSDGAFPLSFGTERAEVTSKDEARVKLKYDRLGGVDVVGNPTSAVTDLPGNLPGKGVYQTFEHGVIVDSSAYGSVFLTQAIFDKWWSLRPLHTEDGVGNLFRHVGFPAEDYLELSDHDEARFQRGKIIVHGGVAYLVAEEIYRRYLDLAPQLGLPLGDEGPESGGGFSQPFQFGELHVTPGQGAFGLWGPVLAHWQSLGGPTSYLGYPRSDTTPVTSGLDGSAGSQCRFENGTIYESASTGANDLSGSIQKAYEKRYGGAHGFLGFPIGNEGTAGSGDPFVDFQAGVIVDHQAVDAHQGIQVFSDMEFRVTNVTGTGDDCFEGICDSQDIYFYSTVHTSRGSLADGVRYPSDDDYDTDSVNPNLRYAMPGFVSSDFSFGVTLSVYDGDNGPDDPLGDLSGTFNIDNLWGRLADSTPEDCRSDGCSNATWQAASEHPVDLTDFRMNGFWPFDNFPTERLDYNEVFAETFEDVTTDEEVWRHPFNHLYWELFFKGISKDGNCYGMSVASALAQKGQSGYAEPIHQYYAREENGECDEKAFGCEIGDLTDSAHQTLMKDLNIRHGSQLSLEMILWTVGQLATGMTHDPIGGFLLGATLNELGDYPVLTFSDGYFGGSVHTVRPYDFGPFVDTCPHRSDGGWCHLIEVADPNEPVTEFTTNEQQPVIISGPFGSTIPPLTTFKYRDYVGSFIEGGRMLVTPSSIVAGKLHTPFATPFQMLDDVVLTLISAGSMDQVTDGDGRELFGPDAPSPPTRYQDMLAEDDPNRIPDIVPIQLSSGSGMSPLTQFYAGRHTSGVTHYYQVRRAPDVPVGTEYEATIETATLSSTFKVPGTDLADILASREMDSEDQAVSFSVPPGGAAKHISWTIAGTEKFRWSELSNLGISAAQTLRIKVGNVGRQLIFRNEGPETSATLRYNPGPGATPLDRGTITIPEGDSTLDVVAPHTTLTTTGEVPGEDGWLLAPVAVTLTAVDESGEGIDIIEYSKDGSTWTKYTGPFSYGDEGVTTLFYRARDRAFNQEDAKSRIFKIDTKKPTAAVTPTIVGSQMSLAFTIADPTPGSGASGLFTISRVGNTTSTVTTFTPVASTPVLLGTACTDLEFWAKDIAGNLESPHQHLTDTKPPVLTLPPAVSVTTCDPSTQVTIGQATATDECSSPVPTGAVIATNGVTLTTPIPVTSGKATLGIGTHTVKWTATDGINSTSANQTVVVGTRLQATDSFIVEDRGIVQNTSSSWVPLYNSGTGLTQLGNDAKSGSLFSVGQIKILHRATATGDAKSASSVFKEADATLTGSLSQFASVVIPPIPTLPSFPSPTLGSFSVTTGTQSPAAGSYQNGSISGGTLVFGSGDYFFRNLTINSSVTVRATSTTRIFVRDTLSLRSPIKASSGSTVQTVFLGFGGSTLTAESTFNGTILAPNATVFFGTDTSVTFTGAFYARKIDLRPASVIKCQ